MKRRRLYKFTVFALIPGAPYGAGRFGVLIDETHARHKISDCAMETIPNGMARP